MKKQYLQSQYILSKVFENENNTLRMTLNTSQDYLNAVYDNSKNALRVSIDGGMLPSVPNEESLPESANINQICPVVSNDSISFFKWDGTKWAPLGSTGEQGSVLTPDEQVAVSWVSEHLQQIKEFADFDYLVNIEDIVLNGSTTQVVVQGKTQNIDDDLNGDDDNTTPYRIDITGYVMSVATYADANSIVPDRYYTRITYDSAGGGLGVSHVYMQQDEYEFFATLPEGKNILRAYYITNAKTSPIKRVHWTLNPNGTVENNEGVYSIIDENDSDGDAQTTYCIECAGYVLGVQTYASEDALVMDKYYTKIVYESDGIHAGKSKIYFENDDYAQFAGFANGKNVMDIYYVATVFPASVTISETQLQFPSTAPQYVAIDASGNARNISDSNDADGDETTCVKITVNGYVLDVDGYYQSTDTTKKRMYVKVSYTPEFDTSDVYFEEEHYNYISSLQNGRNIISIYTLGAGIGIDASRIQATDSALDANSERAIQNKAVKGVVDSLMQEIEQLKQRISALE